MRKGMAAEIRKIQIARKKGDFSMFDMFEAEDLLEIKPCIFDRVDQMVGNDNVIAEQKYDPEVA